MTRRASVGAESIVDTNSSATNYGITRLPNELWCREHAGERVELAYANETFVITLERDDNDD